MANRLSTRVLVAIICMGWVAGPASAREPVAVSVPAGDLIDAVESLAKQSGVDVVYPSNLLRGHRTPGVHGTLRPADAFSKLLEGTTLVLKEENGALLITQAASAPRPASPEQAPPVDEVLVTGEQPGPALWRVNSGEHVLWIMGEVSPLPAKVKWHSKQFERLLASSQEVILEAPDVIRPSKAQAAAERKTRKLPDGMTLQDVVSPDLYARFLATKEVFDRRARTDDLRPLYAANSLYMSAVRSLGLAAFTASVQVSNLAGKADVPITILSTAGLDFAVRLENIETGSTEPCLARAVEMIEDRGSGVRRLANAWAIGDVDALRHLVPAYAALNESHKAGKCMVALYGDERPANEFIARRMQGWLAAAERSLQANASTMAVVPIAELFASDGYLAGLRERGYQVVEPQ